MTSSVTRLTCKFKSQLVWRFGDHRRLGSGSVVQLNRSIDQRSKLHRGESRGFIWFFNDDEDVVYLGSFRPPNWDQLAEFTVLCFSFQIIRIHCSVGSLRSFFSVFLACQNLLIFLNLIRDCLKSSFVQFSFRCQSAKTFESFVLQFFNQFSCLYVHHEHLSYFLKILIEGVLCTYFLVHRTFH